VAGQDFFLVEVLRTAASRISALKADSLVSTFQESRKTVAVSSSPLAKVSFTKEDEV
jgi:hypothetical protein